MIDLLFSGFLYFFSDPLTGLMSFALLFAFLFSILYAILK